mmetsp:Transcript_107468/g.284803  ORF Transcript_107468/g.284803 Transcript_107468/m.284803 type:complete len:326 (+) Transcript_107468:847-1824(+)
MSHIALVLLPDELHEFQGLGREHFPVRKAVLLLASVIELRSGNRVLYVYGHDDVEEPEGHEDIREAIQNCEATSVCLCDQHEDGLPFGGRAVHGHQAAETREQRPCQRRKRLHSCPGLCFFPEGLPKQQGHDIQGQQEEEVRPKQRSDPTEGAVDHHHELVEKWHPADPHDACDADEPHDAYDAYGRGVLNCHVNRSHSELHEGQAHEHKIVDVPILGLAAPVRAAAAPDKCCQHFREEEYGKAEIDGDPARPILVAIHTDADFHRIEDGNETHQELELQCPCPSFSGEAVLKDVSPRKLRDRCRTLGAAAIDVRRIDDTAEASH